MSGSTPALMTCFPHCSNAFTLSPFGVLLGVHAFHSLSNVPTASAVDSNSNFWLLVSIGSVSVFEYGLESLPLILLGFSSDLFQRFEMFSFDFSPTFRRLFIKFSARLFINWPFSRINLPASRRPARAFSHVVGRMLQRLASHSILSGIGPSVSYISIREMV